MGLYLRHQTRAGGFWTKLFPETGFAWILSQSQMLISPMLMQANGPCSMMSLSAQGDLYQGFSFYHGDSDTIFQLSPEKIIE